MFAPYCSRHQSRILLGFESVVGIEQTAFGPKVLLRCYCGEVVVHDMGPSGNGAADPDRAASAV
ncbi:MAG TPA: hypothetical protein VK662_02665 [Acidothermaceae bacterium]|nr:hypothetical protein [Acidothermaceae bacterium]